MVLVVVGGKAVLNFCMFQHLVPNWCSEFGFWLGFEFGIPEFGFRFTEWSW